MLNNVSVAHFMPMPQSLEWEAKAHQALAPGDQALHWAAFIFVRPSSFLTLDLQPFPLFPTKNVVPFTRGKPQFLYDKRSRPILGM